jgi:DMSO/TMAO reductase YedYZ molybdopterin-dependent catalytic subunit
MMTGCDIVVGASAECALRAISRFNDLAEAWLFDQNRLASTYPESAITKPFPFNAYYDEDQAPEVEAEGFKLAVGGLVENKRPWPLEELYALTQETNITRHVCVEGWSAIGKWTGTPLRYFLERIGADTRARYVHFRCAEGCSTSIDMPTALHPQTQITFRFADEPPAGSLSRPRPPLSRGSGPPGYPAEPLVSYRIYQFALPLSTNRDFCDGHHRELVLVITGTHGVVM